MQFEIWFEQVEFIVIACVVIFLAYLALEHKDVVYAAFFFGLMAAFVSGFYLLLEAPFIAGMQIAVYTGGISALIIFAVLLLPRAQDSSLETFASPRRRRGAIILTALVILLAFALGAIYPWSGSFSPQTPPLQNNLELLAQWLWSNHGIYVQMIALILLTAIVGSIAILKMEKAEHVTLIRGEFGIESVEEPIDNIPSEPDDDDSSSHEQEADSS